MRVSESGNIVCRADFNKIDSSGQLHLDGAHDMLILDLCKCFCRCTIRSGEIHDHRKKLFQGFLSAVISLEVGRR